MNRTHCYLVLIVHASSSPLSSGACCRIYSRLCLRWDARQGPRRKRQAVASRWALYGRIKHKKTDEYALFFRPNILPCKCILFCLIILILLLGQYGWPAVLKYIDHLLTGLKLVERVFGRIKVMATQSQCWTSLSFPRLSSTDSSPRILTSRMWSEIVWSCRLRPRTKDLCLSNSWWPFPARRSPRNLYPRGHISLQSPRCVRLLAAKWRLLAGKSLDSSKSWPIRCR